MTDNQAKMLQERFARILRDYIGDRIVVDHMAHEMAEATKIARAKLCSDIPRRESTESR